MADCVSNPFSSSGGSTQTSSLIAAKIEECCEETNTNLSSIATKLDTLIAAQASCCSTISTKLDTIATKLQLIVDNCG